MSSSLTSTEPSPITFTIRLKHHKVTVLLHIQPLMSLSLLKEELLAVLNNISPDGVSGHALPTNSSEVEFAKPLNPTDMSAGWEPLEPKDEIALDFGEDDSKPSNSKTDAQALQTFGIKENAVLAFRWAGMKQRGWDVVQPTFQDEYGYDNEADMGVPREFKG